jgi:hypothetical protein
MSAEVSYPISRRVVDHLRQLNKEDREATLCNLMEDFRAWLEDKLE